MPGWTWSPGSLPILQRLQVADNQSAPGGSAREIPTMDAITSKHPILRVESIRLSQNPLDKLQRFFKRESLETQSESSGHATMVLLVKVVVRLNQNHQEDI